MLSSEDIKHGTKHMLFDSSAYQDTHPDNKISSFTCSFPREVDLTRGTWQMGCSTISHSNDIVNVAEVSAYTKQYSYNNALQDIEAIGLPRYHHTLEIGFLDKDEPKYFKFKVRDKNTGQEIKGLETTEVHHKSQVIRHMRHLVYDCVVQRHAPLLYHQRQFPQYAPTKLRLTFLAQFRIIENGSSRRFVTRTVDDMLIYKGRWHWPDLCDVMGNKLTQVIRKELDYEHSRVEVNFIPGRGIQVIVQEPAARTDALQTITQMVGLELLFQHYGGVGNTWGGMNGLNIHGDNPLWWALNPQQLFVYSDPVRTTSFSHSDVNQLLSGPDVVTKNEIPNRPYCFVGKFYHGNRTSTDHLTVPVRTDPAPQQTEFYLNLKPGSHNPPLLYHYLPSHLPTQEGAEKVYPTESVGRSLNFNAMFRAYYLPDENLFEESLSGNLGVNLHRTIPNQNVVGNFTDDLWDVLQPRDLVTELLNHIQNQLVFGVDGEGRLVINAAATKALEGKVALVLELGNEAGVHLPWSKFVGSDVNVHGMYIRNMWCEWARVIFRPHPEDNSLWVCYKAGSPPRNAATVDEFYSALEPSDPMDVSYLAEDNWVPVSELVELNAITNGIRLTSKVGPEDLLRHGINFIQLQNYADEAGECLFDLTEDYIMLRLQQKTLNMQVPSFYLPPSQAKVVLASMSYRSFEANRFMTMRFRGEKRLRMSSSDLPLILAMGTVPTTSFNSYTDVTDLFARPLSEWRSFDDVSPTYKMSPYDVDRFVNADSMENEIMFVGKKNFHHVTKHVARIEEGSYMNIPVLIEAIKKAFWKCQEPSGEAFDFGKYVSIQPIPGSTKISMEMKDAGLYDTVVLLVSPSLSHMMGFAWHYRPLVMRLPGVRHQGNGYFGVRGKVKVESDYPTDLTRGIHHLIVECDWLHPSWTGTRDRPSLTMQPLVYQPEERKSVSNVAHAPTNFLWHPVRPGSYQKISFKVVDFNGDLIRFQHHSAPTVLQVTLRKV